jgi:hypothetical protein
MTVQALRERVTSLTGTPGTPALLCITGASGAGKTTALAALRTTIDARVLPALFFDSLGVPPEAHMHAAWESPRGWQKAMTWFWVQAAKNVYRTHPLVVLEGSYDPQYAIAACSANRMRHAVVLLHAEPPVLTQRLSERGQPELATEDMASWARYLHETTPQLGGHVVDASASVTEVVDAICARGLALLAEGPVEPRRRSN